MTPLDKSSRAAGPSSAGYFGALLGIVAFCVSFTSTRIDDIILFALIGMEAIVFSVVVWIRTRLPLMTLAGVIAALLVGAQISVNLSSSGGGTNLVHSDYPAWWGLGILIPVLFYGESLWHQEKWTSWKAHMRGCSILDMLLLRHVPYLREKSDEPTGISRDDGA